MQVTNKGLMPKTFQINVRKPIHTMENDEKIATMIMQVGYGAFQLSSIPLKLIVKGVDSLQAKPPQDLSITEINFLRELLNLDGRVFNLNQEQNEKFIKQISKLDTKCLKKAEEMLKDSKYKDHPGLIKDGLTDIELRNFITDIVINGRPRNLSNVPITFLNQAAKALLIHDCGINSDGCKEKVAIRFFRMYLILGNPTFAGVSYREEETDCGRLDKHAYDAIKKIMIPILDAERKERENTANNKIDESDPMYPLGVLTALSKIRIFDK